MSEKRVLGWLIGVWFLVVASQAGWALPVDTILLETGSSQFQFEVEVADDEGERSQGLMFRQELAENAGMLFLYPNERQVSFWMKNTLLPLDMIFIRSDGTIAEIVENAPPLSEETIRSNEPIVAVLEINGGTTRKLGIRIGDRIRHAKYFP